MVESRMFRHTKGVLRIQFGLVGGSRDACSTSYEGRESGKAFSVGVGVVLYGGKVYVFVDKRFVRILGIV